MKNSLTTGHGQIKAMKVTDKVTRTSRALNHASFEVIANKLIKVT